MITERFWRAALVGLATVPGFFGACARPEDRSAEVQQAQTNYPTFTPLPVERTNEALRIPQETAAAAVKATMNTQQQRANELRRERVEGTATAARQQITARAEPTSPAPAPQAQRQELTIRKSPEQLYKALLTTPIEPTLLPPGFSSKGNSAGTLDATARAFKAIGQVNIQVAELSSNLSVPNGAISYTIFPNSQEANGAFETLASQPGAHKLTPRPEYPYPGVYIFTSSFLASVSMAGVLMDNSLVVGFITRSSLKQEDHPILQNNTLWLITAGINHLKKVKEGRG